MAGLNDSQKWCIGVIVAVAISATAIVATVSLSRSERRMEELDTLRVECVENRITIAGLEKDVSYIRARIEDIYEWMKARQQ